MTGNIQDPNLHKGLLSYDVYSKLEVKKRNLKYEIITSKEKLKGIGCRTFCYVSCGQEDNNRCDCNRYVSIIHPVFWTGLAAGLIVGLSTGIPLQSLPLGLGLGFGIPAATTTVSTVLFAIRYFTTRNPLKQTIENSETSLKDIATIQTDLPFEKSDEMFDVEEGLAYFKFVTDEEIKQFNFRQLFMFYKKFPEVFWNAFDRKIIRQEERLILYKFDQLVSLDKENLLNALKDTGNTQLLEQDTFILETFIQSILEDCWKEMTIRDILIACVEKDNDILELIRKGHSIKEAEEIKKNKNDPNNIIITLVVDGYKLKINKKWLIENSKPFQAMLNGKFKENCNNPGVVKPSEDKATEKTPLLDKPNEQNGLEFVLPDTDAGALKYIIDCLMEGKTLNTNTKEWIALYACADQWQFEESLKSLQGWANVNIENIVQNGDVKEFANFFKARNLHALFVKLDGAYKIKLESLVEILSFKELDDSIKSTTNQGLVQSRKYLIDWVSNRLSSWVQRYVINATNLKSFVENLLSYIRVFAIENGTFNNKFEKNLLDVIDKRVNEETAKEAKLLPLFWEEAKKHNMNILKSVIAKYCQQNKYFSQIAWVTVPDELQSLILLEEEKLKNMEKQKSGKA